MQKDVVKGKSPEQRENDSIQVCASVLQGQQLEGGEVE